MKHGLEEEAEVEGACSNEEKVEVADSGLTVEELSTTFLNS